MASSPGTHEAMWIYNRARVRLFWHGICPLRPLAAMIRSALIRKLGQVHACSLPAEAYLYVCALQVPRGLPSFKVTVRDGTTSCAVGAGSTEQTHPMHNLYRQQATAHPCECAST